MGQYTELLEIDAETLSPDDDNYEESLLKTAASFRGFDEALTAFIEEHGYTGDLANVPAKAQFLREKFRAANVKLPRSFREWFVPGKKLARKTAFQICFAFGLGVDETNDFFRCVQFERGFDCHTISEAVYYFCMKNGLSYAEAQEMIARIDRIPGSKKTRAIPDREVLYTGTIIEYINAMKDKEDLIQYITDSIDDFRYNNATAVKYVQELWADISKEDGLAAREGTMIDKTRNRFENKHKKGDTDTRFAEVIDEEVRQQEQEVKPYDYVTAGPDASTWTIFAQIIGLPNYMENEYAVRHDRSLASVLSENALMPLNASYCFPGQHSIDKLLRGELADNEMMRKMLIFLVFYTYWAKVILSKDDVFYSAKRSDSERCLETINNRLLNAGYPELYVGNPYDWIFMWSLNDEHPLDAFRTYMGEVFAVKEEQEETED